MLIKRRRGWELPESAATPEHLFVRRRQLLQGLAAGPILLASGMLRPAAAQDGDPTADLYPVARNPRYELDQRIPGLSDERLVTTYNNFYEFGSHKQISQAAQALQIRPWTVTLDGMVEQEQTVAVDDLIRQMPLEERVYRHRCVEAWSMAVPWSGFPLKALVDLARPLGSAQYVRMETFLDPEMASGQKQFWYP
jgi:sulfoxide reductase catalytic subunit YedY